MTLETRTEQSCWVTCARFDWCWQIFEQLNIYDLCSFVRKDLRYFQKPKNFTYVLLFKFRKKILVCNRKEPHFGCAKGVMVLYFMLSKDLKVLFFEKTLFMFSWPCFYYWLFVFVQIMFSSLFPHGCYQARTICRESW